MHHVYMYIHVSPADDDNRVVLKPMEEHTSDYINGSYVDVST